MILTVGNTKGGVGKTTLALNLAIWRAHADRSVWLVDGDRQGTALTALSQRAVAGADRPAVHCGHYVDGLTLRAQVAQQAPRWDDVVIDAGGQDSTALRAALVLSDVVLVPVHPRSFEVWAFDLMRGLVTEAQAVNPRLQALVVLNCADAGELGRDNAEASQILRAVEPFRLLDTPVRRRKAIANAGGQGLSPHECRPLDKKAVEELAALATAVWGAL